MTGPDEDRERAVPSEPSEGLAAPEGLAGDRVAGRELLEAVKVMARLRAPDGCPWDREQTHLSLRRNLLEEAHEVLDAIESGDPARLREELGDLLIQVIFHAQIAEDAGEFTVDDVAAELVDKLVRRHPHVFGTAEADTADAVLRNWDRIKAEEKAGYTVDEDIPATLPELMRATKIQRRAGAHGFEWSSADGAMAKVREELEELAAAGSPEEIEAELGDLLFAVVAVARAHGVDPEGALRGTSRRFAERFEALRAWAEREGVDLAGLPEEELVARFRDLRPSPG